MRLTKTDKEAFVRAVMDDVPKHDFDEMAKLMVIGHFKKVLPKEIVAIIEDKNLRDYIESGYVCMPREIDGFYTRYRPLGFQGWEHLPDDVKVRLDEFCTFKKDQTAQRDALRSQLRGMIEPLTTLKAALAKLPEFAKYLPAGLPVANVVADLNKAGWPKKEKADARTKRIVQQAQQWREAHEQESKADPVPALQDGALSDQAREVPAAPSDAGAALPDVESEGGHAD